MPKTRRFLFLIAIGLLVRPLSAEEPKPTGAKPDAQAVEFFEKSVRPVLVTHCIGCHGSEKQKAGLRLDSRAGLMNGGESGPAIVLGKPGDSRLIDAINYGDLQMPPKTKLAPGEIQSLTRWVEMNAPWPESVAIIASKSVGATAAWDERRKHWSLQPIGNPQPPAVMNAAWPSTPIDRFILAGLEAKGLKPAADADRRTWLRRVTFDLIGLPPTIAEINAFLGDAAANAQEKVVDRLLASPHYGERWGRHWLDLVRYAETSGHEFDYDIPDAWRYRDYVIRSFNADLPYDQFVTEQVAGDLLPNPRRNLVAKTIESILGTGFFYLCEGTHSPVDLRDEEASRIDNQIDVFSKTFLGMTLACARCHDHKFDAITTRDYYALSGFLKSSRHHHAMLNEESEIRSIVDQLTAVKREIGVAMNPAKTTATKPTARVATATATDTLIFEDFNKSNYEGWFAAGPAFGKSPTGPGEFRVSKRGEEPAILPVTPGLAHSGLISPKLQGTLRSRTFTIEHPFIYYLAGGSGGRINIVIDGFEKIRSPIYGGLLIDIQAPELRWHRMDVTMWMGHEAYIELADGATVDYSGGNSQYSNGAGDLIVDQIVFSKHSSPPPALPGKNVDPPRQAAKDSAVRALIDRYHAIEDKLPAPIFGLAISAGTPEDDKVHIRGNPRYLGEVVPRRFIEVIDPQPKRPNSAEPTRLELARKLIDPANPLTSRVMVNRIWKHHFGEGLVRSPDDYGAMGQAPGNPQLLDWLAREFMRSGWSINHMHKLMTLSHVYHLSSVANPQADRVDPSNTLLHRMEVHRLEGETARDAILAVSGRLDRTMFGPSIPVHLTPFMDGRGRPGHSGPLDGAGRRTIYLNVRRNFISPFLLAFDYPTPTSCIGRRNVSNVPAQALTLLNDPFVLTQAKLWAEHTLATKKPQDERVTQLYLAAFGRPPTASEQTMALAYLKSASQNDDDLAAWTDLCHVLMNVKEFIFIN